MTGIGTPIVFGDEDLRQADGVGAGPWPVHRASRVGEHDDAPTSRYAPSSSRLRRDPRGKRVRAALWSRGFRRTVVGIAPSVTLRVYVQIRPELLVGGIVRSEAVACDQLD